MLHESQLEVGETRACIPHFKPRLWRELGSQMNALRQGPDLVD
jgi:hypothetical protein